LDIQYLMGVAGNATTVFWSLGSTTNGQEPFLTWITNVLGSSSIPWVHSVSYGDDEDTLSLTFMSRVNTEFMKAGVRGITILFATGDNGVYGGNVTSECLEFIPSFPPSSPYVTAVGATLFSTNTIPICNEDIYGIKLPCHTLGEIVSSTAVGSRVSSGGGFSNQFKRPDYQSPIVDSYVASLNIPETYYSNVGRVYPDVATIGHNYLVIINGEITPVDGTSASTPTFAAIVTLLNDKQLNNGFSPLGFLNPWLYQVAELSPLAFNDIKIGDNSCSEVSWICCNYGYSAAIGYDAVTGIGSPNFQILSENLPI